MGSALGFRRSAAERARSRRPAVVDAAPRAHRGHWETPPGDPVRLRWRAEAEVLALDRERGRFSLSQEPRLRCRCDPLGRHRGVLPSLAGPRELVQSLAKAGGPAGWDVRRRSSFFGLVYLEPYG